MKKITLSLMVVFAIASCSPVRMLVKASNIYDSTITEATYNDFNFTQSLFNQYSSLLSYELEITLPNTLTQSPIRYYTDGSTYETLTGFVLQSTSPNVYTVELNATWKGYFNTVFFGRNFDSVGVAERYPAIRFRKWFVSGSTDTYIRLKIESAIRYRVDIGSMLLGLTTNMTYSDPEPEAASLIEFFDENNNNLGGFNVFNLEYQEPTPFTPTMYQAAFPQIFNNVSRFDWTTSIIGSGNSGDWYIDFSEMNLFTDNTSIAVPDNAEKDLFGITYTQVEWYDIIGHFSNFIWWIVNDSFLTPIFEWIDTYILSFFVSIFNLLGDLLGL